MKTDKFALKVGWIASLMGFLMYFSFIDQIMRNLSGHKGSLFLALAATINSCSWVLYGSLKQQKDWPMISCNVFGILLSAATAITSL